MEKVENLCRTARAQNELINTSVQFRSRLRDASGTDRHARDNCGIGPLCAITLISKSRKPSQSEPRGERLWRVGSNRLAVAAGGREPATASAPMTSKIRL